jgi:hypothetical protein
MMTYYLIGRIAFEGSQSGEGETPVERSGFIKPSYTAKKSIQSYQIIIIFPAKSGTMARNTSGLLCILLLILAGFMMASGCTAGNPPVVMVSPTQTPVVTTAPSSAQSCMTDDDCVPAQCCHSTSCTNKANKGVCNLMCTMSCEGPIDCGAGSCGCVNGKCSVVPSATSSLTTVTKLP